MLLALLIVPLVLLAYLAIERRRARYAVRYTNLDVLAAVAVAAPRWRRWVPPALLLLALTAAVAALARPELSRTGTREQASIVLTIDISGSMQAEDVKPTRLGAAQEAVRRFLDKLPKKYRVGLVTFSSEPHVASTLTHDRQLVRDALEYVYSGRGTAIGDALARSVDLLRPVVTEADVPRGSSPRQSDDPAAPIATIVLLSDGAQTRGTLEPLQGAARARSYGIPIHTIALGTPEGVITRGPWVRPVPPDPVTLRRIAQATGGKFFETRDEKRLTAVYENLATNLGARREWREATSLFLGIAALLALAAGAFSVLWTHRLP